ncbi:Gfo/Idh/MocA family oxidoreductase [Niabella terrae]
MTHFAIIGCGEIAERHALAASANGTLLGVYDTDNEKAARLAVKYNCRVYRSYDELLHDQTIDVLSICTPNYLHAPQSIEAMEKGFHVVCEKPMAISKRDAQQMIDTSKKTGRHLFIVKQMRDYPGLRTLKSWIDAGRLGHIEEINLVCLWNRDATYYRDWRGKLSSDGGTLYTQFSHHIDLLLWLFGPIESATLSIRNFARNEIEFESDGGIYFQMGPYTSGSFYYSVDVPKNKVGNSLQIETEKGSLHLTGTSLQKVKEITIEGIEAPGSFSVTPRQNSHIECYRKACETISSASGPGSDAAESFASIALIESLYQNR